MNVSSLSIEDYSRTSPNSGSNSPDSAQSQILSPASPSGSTLSYDEYLKVATDTSASILLELNMDGRIRYLSSIWEHIVGTSVEAIVGQSISDILVGSDQDRSVFQRAIDLMIREDCSYKVRFLVESGSTGNSKTQTSSSAGSDNGTATTVKPELIELDAQGIIIAAGINNLPTHSMWIVKPFCEMGNITDLPQDLVKRLGFGATIFSQYLSEIEDSMVTDELDLPTPKNELCRVCESPVPAWWLETHSESCIVEHKIESVVQLHHDKLVELRMYIEEMFMSIEANDGRITQYNGLPLPKASETALPNSPCGALVSDDTSAFSIFKKSSNGRKNSNSIFQTLRFPFKTLASLIELCDDAINTNTSELKEIPGAAMQHSDAAQVLYEFSPGTQKNIENIITWKHQSEVTNPALDLLKTNTLALASRKVEFLFRLDNAMKYSLKIKNEIDNYVLQLIREKLERNKLNTMHSGGISRISARSPANSTLSEESEPTMPGGKIASPRPQKAPSGLFADAYVGTDEIPRKIQSPSNHDAMEEFDSRNNSRSCSQSITPKQPHPESNFVHEKLNVEQPKIYESVGGTPKLILPDSSGHPRTSGNHDFTPRRDSLPSSGGVNTPLSSLQKNAIFRPGNHGSFDRSPITSPYAGSSDYLTPEVQSVAVPKQPLSPLLLATNQAKASTPSIRDYDIIKPISKGAYGSVYLAKRRITGEYFAIKVLKKSDMIVKNQVTNVKSERAIMMVQSNKPYVAQLFATFQNRGNLFLVMEYLSGGDLATLIKMMGNLPEQWTKQYITEVIYGVAEMHQSGIIHHDLKPDNLLIDSRGHLKLTDFGLSRMGLVTRHTLADQKESQNASRKDSATSEDNLNVDRAFKWKLRSDSPTLSHALDGVIFKTERSNSNSSSQSALEVPVLHRSGSQLSFSIADFPGGGSPPPMSLHKRASSNISENWENNSPTPDYALFNPEDSKHAKRFFGTPDYLAPETIEGTGETDACDWWSVGCMLFEFSFGYPPFHARTVEEVFSNILAGMIDWPKFPDEEAEREFVSNEAKDLISRLLVVDPSKRLGANGAHEIFEHPYFKDVDWEQLYAETGSFVPEVAHPESTDYFDLRGAQLEDFSESDTEQSKVAELLTSDLDRAPKRTSSERSSQSTTPVQKLTVGSVLESGSQDDHSNNNSPTAKHIPMAIPPHLRERRVSKLNEVQTEFGSFNFRNLPALDRANKDAINRLKNEHLVEQGFHHHHRASSGSSSSSDVSNKHRYTKSSSVNTSAGVSGMPTRTSASPSSAKHHSPSRRDSNEMAVINRRSAGSMVENALNSPSSFYDETGSPSPASRFKSSLSPQNTCSRARLQSRTSSKRSSLGDVFTDESDELRALSRAASTRGRRRSERKSSSGISDIVYNLDILVCEPIPIHRFKLTKDLETLGCSVISVSMGDEMVRRATSDVKFDLIFTALKLPKLGAIDIVKLLRNTNSSNSTTPIVAVTAFFQEAQQACVFDDVLERPVSVQQLRSLLLKYTLKKSQDADETMISDADPDVPFAQANTGDALD
ncbi:LANO_0D10242g1_1 [Lachancea nothofagi CBS 11611]|uniref:non-specific serine/threonine protein kinase n=1 Tax=Lachancea nothofagi CBS 11611 TaxID=1266666 RepID=A0A1G4JK95_9SACH|nr:LANO_0D10242g1_1 [Lachancea nothofagi CBS 11611]